MHQLSWSVELVVYTTNSGIYAYGFCFMAAIWFSSRGMDGKIFMCITIYCWRSYFLKIDLIVEPIAGNCCGIVFT